MSPSAQELLARHAMQQQESGLFEVYGRHMATLAIIVHETAEPKESDASNQDEWCNAIRRWARAEVPLVPYRMTRRTLRGLWIARLNEHTGAVFRQSQMIVAHIPDPETDPEDAEIEFSAGITTDQFEMLSDQMIELDGLGLKPQFETD